MKRLILALILLLVLVAVPARAAEIYVSCSGTAVGGDGSSGDPYRDMTTALAHASTGDTIYVTGNCREYPLTITDNFVTIKTLAGTVTPALITGNSTSPQANVLLWKKDTDADGDVDATDQAAAIPEWAETSWAKTAGTGDGEYFEIDIRDIADSDIASVTINYETSMDQYGRRYGHLRKATSVSGGGSDVASTDGSYYLDTSGTPERLYVNPEGDVGGAMTGKTVRVARNDCGLYANGTNGLTLEKIDFGPFCENSSSNTGTGAAWCVLLDGVSNVYVDRCRFFDAGRHAFGWTSGSGTTVENCLVKNCFATGIRYSDSTTFVVNTGNGGVIRNVTFEDCTVISCGPLTEYDSSTGLTDLYTTGENICYYAHGASGGDPEIESLTFKRCIAKGFDDTDMSIQAFGADYADSAADYTKFKNYPVKIIECEAYGVDSIGYINGGMAIQRCRFNTEAFATGGGMNSTTVGGLWVGNATSNLYMESTVIVTNTAQAGNSNRVFNWSGEMCLVNNLILNYDPDMDNFNYIIWPGSAANTKLRCYQNIFACMSKTTGLAEDDGWLFNFAPIVGGNITEIDVKGNAYIGISKPSGSTSYDTWAEYAGDSSADENEWQSSGFFSDQYQSNSLAANIKFAILDQSRGDHGFSTILDIYRSMRTTYVPEMGINYHEYDGQFGPYQWGDNLLDRIGVGPFPFRNRSRP